MSIQAPGPILDPPWVWQPQRIGSITPKNGDPCNVRFIQAYNQSLTGSPYQTFLDNNAAPTPFYDDTGAAGTYANAAKPGGGKLADGSSWLADIPYDTEAQLMARAGT